MFYRYNLALHSIIIIDDDDDDDDDDDNDHEIALRSPGSTRFVTGLGTSIHG